jgi:hypothetical protein
MERERRTRTANKVPGAWAILSQPIVGALTLAYIDTELTNKTSWSKQVIEHERAQREASQ